LLHEDVAKSLGAAAAALSSEAFNKWLVALQSQYAPAHSQLCLAMVAAAHLPALQQRMMEAVMGSVLSGGKLSASLGRDACGALAEALCGGSPNLPGQLVDPFLGPFAAALLAHEGCPSLLREVLQQEAVQAAACDERIAPLVRKRVGQVEIWTARGPPGSWEQPGAWLPELPDIQAFLRGPEKELKVGWHCLQCLHASVSAKVDVLSMPRRGNNACFHSASSLSFRTIRHEVHGRRATLLWRRISTSSRLDTA
jgi:hypothetical protein